MSIQSLMDFMEQYQANGGDLGEAAGYINSLAADSGTPFLKLNQWKRSDKPVMDDFNDDNRKIDDAILRLDETLRALSEQKADKAVPQKHSLNLLNGFQKLNSAEYFKTADGQVIISFKVGKGGAAIPVGTYTIANLPEGFRPLTYVAHTIVSDAVFRGNITVCWIGPDGDLKVRNHTAIPADATAGFVGSMTYVTA